MFAFSLKSVLTVAAFTLLAQGCNGKSDQDARRGIFLDSPVGGLKYFTETRSGLTDKDGAFYYNDGETIVFAIGEIYFPGVTAAPTVTPLDIAQVDDVQDEKAINLLRLLQSMDVDQNPDNGITIPESAHETVKPPRLAFDGSIDVEEFITSVVNQAYPVQRPLVDSETAVNHFVATLSQTVQSESIDVNNNPLTFLVARDEVFNGDFLSVKDDAYALNLDGNWEGGNSEQSHNVLRLQSSAGENRFVTSVSNNNQLFFCIESRPTDIDGCEHDNLFAVFPDQASAQAFSWASLAAPAEAVAVEPLIGAAVEEETSEQGGVSEQEADVVQEAESAETVEQDADSGQDAVEAEPAEPEAGPIQETGSEEFDEQSTVSEGDDTTVEPDESGTEQEQEQESDSTEPVSAEVNSSNSEDSASDGTTNENVPVTVPQSRVIQTTTDCPASATAPTQLPVTAHQPVGCVWTNFESSPWVWNPSGVYDFAANTLNIESAGIYAGEFEHTCIEQTSGEVIVVRASCSISVESGPGPQDITDLFFITGQANASGVETAYDATIDVPDNRVYAYTDSGWQVADLRQNWEKSIPGNFSTSDSTRSPYNHIGFQLTRAIAEQADRVVGLVVLTEPGEGISHWDYNSEFFVAMREKATAALNELPNKSQFDAVIWMQGETDWLFEGTADLGATGFPDINSDEYRNYYPNKLSQLVNNFRSEFWFRFDGRFICAETKKADLNPHLMALNSDGDLYTGCAEASDLATRSSDPFGNHFSADSLRILGSRIADVYLSMVN